MEEEELAEAGMELESERDVEELIVDVIVPASTLAGVDDGDEDIDELLGKVKLSGRS